MEGAEDSTDQLKDHLQKKRLRRQVVLTNKRKNIGKGGPRPLEATMMRMANGSRPMATMTKTDTGLRLEATMTIVVPGLSMRDTMMKMASGWKLRTLSNNSSSNKSRIRLTLMTEVVEVAEEQI